MINCKCGGTLKKKGTIPATTTSFEKLVYECDRCKAIDEVLIAGGPNYYEKAIILMGIESSKRSSVAPKWHI